jgi:hypothetical protein
MSHALESHPILLNAFSYHDPRSTRNIGLPAQRGEDLLQEAHDFQIVPTRRKPKCEDLPRINVYCGSDVVPVSADLQLDLIDDDDAPAPPLRWR